MLRKLENVGNLPFLLQWYFCNCAVLTLIPPESIWSLISPVAVPKTLQNKPLIKSKKLIFFMFWQFSNLFMPEDWITPVNLQSFFIKIDVIDSSMLIFEKDWLWWNQSSYHKKLSIQSKTDDQIPNPTDKWIFYPFSHFCMATTVKPGSRDTT